MPAGRIHQATQVFLRTRRSIVPASEYLDNHLLLHRFLPLDLELSGVLFCSESLSPSIDVGAKELDVL